MIVSSLLKFSAFGLSTIIFHRKKPILGTIQKGTNKRN